MTGAFTDPLADAGLFDIDAATPITLADKFGVPPLSVLDARSGMWQERKRRWLSLGIKSEAGRDVALTYAGRKATDDVGMKLLAISGGTSVFDPVLCELVYRWFSRQGDQVLDPFCGGTVRGVAAGILGRDYYGTDIRPEQIDTNYEQADRIPGLIGTPTWLVGDATKLDTHPSVPAGAPYDLVFSCPPYADLEVYSDDPRDISTWPYEDFRAGHAKAIADSVAMLAPDRYAAWVIGDVRDKRGAYRGLHHDTVEAFEAAGCSILNEFVLVTMVGTAPIRAERPFVANRKATLGHQHLIVAVKGDIRRAAERVQAS